MPAVAGGARPAARVRIDAPDPGLEPSGDLGAPLEVVRPHARAKPEVGGVGALERVLDVGVLDQRNDRPELLLVDDPDALLPKVDGTEEVMQPCLICSRAISLVARFKHLHVGQHRRLVEVALEPVRAEAIAAGHHPRAVGL